MSDTITLSKKHGQALIGLLSRTTTMADAAEQEAMLALICEMADPESLDCDHETTLTDEDGTTCERCGAEVVP